MIAARILLVRYDDVADKGLHSRGNLRGALRSSPAHFDTIRIAPSSATSSETSPVTIAAIPLIFIWSVPYQINSTTIAAISPPPIQWLKFHAFGRDFAERRAGLRQCPRRRADRVAKRGYAGIDV